LWPGDGSDSPTRTRPGWPPPIAIDQLKEGVGDLTLAEDLVAEAYARAWASWRKVSRHPAPPAWVVCTALNACKK
jgi:predicted RNA polymerase sigma factor